MELPDIYAIENGCIRPAFGPAPKHQIISLRNMIFEDDLEGPEIVMFCGVMTADNFDDVVERLEAMEGELMLPDIYIVVGDQVKKAFGPVLKEQIIHLKALLDELQPWDMMETVQGMSADNCYDAIDRHGDVIKFLNNPLAE